MRDQLKVYSSDEVVYAAFARCRCGAGLAYVKGRYEKEEAKDNPAYSHWNCSKILTKDIKIRKIEEGHIFASGTIQEEDGTLHDGPRGFAFFEIKSEMQPSANGATTRDK